MFKKSSPRDVQAIVEAQVRKWSIDDKGRARERAAASPVDPWPLITVSREFGTLGAAVGNQVAQRLGFSFWDQELVTAIAEQTGAQEALVASLDEKARGRLDDFIREAVVGVEGTVGEYVRQVARVVGTIEDHGGAVIIGRGAQFILAPGAALRVRVVCPREQRVAGFAEREGLSQKEAERIVKQVTRERQAFLQRHYNRDAGEPVHYDIVLNTGFYTVAGAATVVVAAYEAKFGRLPVGAHGGST